MTRQIPDLISLDDENYAIVGLHNNSQAAALFHPRRNGIEISNPPTCCWRGYSCLYSILDSDIGLKRLNICLSKQDAAANHGFGKVLFNKTPETITNRGHWYSHQYSYESPISGLVRDSHILIAKEICESSLLPFPFYYRILKEIVIRNSKVDGVIDHSSQVVKVVGRLCQVGNQQPDSDTLQKKVFSRNYRSQPSMR